MARPHNAIQNPPNTIYKDAPVDCMGRWRWEPTGSGGGIVVPGCIQDGGKYGG